jgi:hypothetical protein
MAMNDKTEAEDQKEPVDAEFETLQDEDSNDKPAGVDAKPASRRLWIVLSGVGVLALIIIAASWIVMTQRRPVLTGESPNPPLETLAAQVKTLKDELNAVQVKTSAELSTMGTQLEALEATPPQSANLSQDLAELQTRLNVLEQTQALPNGDNEALQNMVQQLDQLDTQVRVLGEGGADQTGEVAGLADLRRRVLALESAPPANSTDVDTSAQTQALQKVETQLATLQSRVNALEQQNQSQNHVSTLALGLLALDSTAQTGAPFVREWQVIARLLPQNEDVNILAPLAKTGVPGRDALVRDFAQYAQAVRATQANKASKLQEKTGIMGRAGAALGSLVSVRRVEDKANGVEALLNTADAALQQGDLLGAVRRLEQLEGDAHQAVQAWLTQAQARLTLDQALARLKSQTGEASP